jgi:hypothetical protein
MLFPKTVRQIRWRLAGRHEIIAAKAKRVLEPASQPPKRGHVNETADMTRDRCHVDYHKTIRGVLQKESKSLLDMFKCSTCVDGAAGDGYGRDIQAALDYCGEPVFAGALKNPPGQWRQSVIEALVWNRDAKLLRKLYPPHVQPRSASGTGEIAVLIWLDGCRHHRRTSAP